MAHQYGTCTRVLQHQDEEQWAKDRVLMHINSHAKLLIVLTIDPHMAVGSVVYILDDTHNPFVHTQAPQGPPQELSWHMMEDFLYVNEGKLEPFVSNGNVLLLLLANKMASVVPSSGTKANCISSVFPIWWMDESSTRSSSFMAQRAHCLAI